MDSNANKKIQKKYNSKNDFYDLRCPYWTNKMKLEFLQRRIIVACIIYYEMNESIINDDDYESISRQYLNLVSETDKETLKNTKYYYVMQKYDGSTGNFIFGKLKKEDKRYLSMIANIVLSLKK